MYKKLILLLLIFNCRHIHSKSPLSTAQHHELEQAATQWAAAQQALDPLSKQLIGNFLYFSYKQSSLDELVYRQSAMLIRVLKKNMNVMEQYKNPKGTTSLLAYTMQQFCKTTRLRYETYMAWNHCNTYLEEHAHDQVLQALEELRKQGERCLATYTHTHRKRIDQSIKKTQEALEADQADLQKALNALRVELRSIDPSFIDSQLIMLDFALKTCNQEECSSWNILNHINHMRQHQLELLAVNKSFFFVHYAALFEQLQQLDNQYQMILFSPRGLLTKQDQTARLEP